jgi:hypothetical protein
MPRLRPYDRAKDDDPWPERREWEALVGSDFDGLPRETLVSNIKHLATRLLELTAQP